MEENGDRCGGMVRDRTMLFWISIAMEATRSKS